MDQISIKLIEHLESGGVVAYPTSTLPGLGSLPSKKGLDELFSLKKRSEDQPVSLGVFSLQQAEDLVEVPNFAKTLLENFPLGSITLILDAKEKLDSRLEFFLTLWLEC